MNGSQIAGTSVAVSAELIPDRGSFEAPHQPLNVIVHDLSEITLIARGCRVAMGLHHPLNLLKGAGPIGRLCGGHIFVNRPFGHRDAIGVSNSNQSSQVAGAFFKICHPPNMRAVPRVFQPGTPPQSACPLPKGFDGRSYAGKSRWLIGLSAQEKSPGTTPRGFDFRNWSRKISTARWPGRRSGSSGGR